MAAVPTVSELPPQWGVFVDAVATGADPVETAKALNLANPKRSAALLMRHPKVRAALVEASQAKLYTRGVQLAWDVIEEIMTDRCPKAKAVRGKMAIALLDRIDGPAAKDKGFSPGRRPIGEMTLEELEQEVQAARSARPLASDMRDVTPGQGEE